MQEPVINANGLSVGETYAWMEQKIMAAKRLRELLATKADLERQLTRIDGQIEEATVQSRIEVYRQDQDPIHHQ